MLAHIVHDQLYW